MKLIFALILAATPLHAGDLSDAILTPGVFQTLQEDLRYAHKLQIPGQEAVGDTFVLVPQADRLTLKRDDKPVTDFSRASAHPIVMYFLESTVRHMAEATGGSPFYIRNRIRDALVAAPIGADVTPFTNDPNRDKMGEFGGLTLRFVLEGADIVSLSADTPDPGKGYHESMTLAEGS